MQITPLITSSHVMALNIVYTLLLEDDAQVGLGGSSCLPITQDAKLGKL